MSATPSWLTESGVDLPPSGHSGRRRKRSFVDKTIDGASNLLRQALFAEDLAARDGLLQRIDPRMKIVTLGGLLLTAALVRHIPVLIAMYVATLLLARLSGLSLTWFVKRVWLFIPIFTGIIVLPAIFSFVTPGEVVLHLGSWLGHPVGITAQGLSAAGLIVTRVATSISLVVLLTLTTPWAGLLAGLRALRVPKMFLMVLAMAYRYLFHLLGAVTDMYTARNSRDAGRAASARRGREFVAASGGALFGKAHALSEEVYMAMVSRGYSGRPHAIDGFRLGRVDLLWAAGCAAAAAAVMGADRLLGV